MWVRTVLPESEIKRCLSPGEVEDLLVAYHLFQTAVFFGDSLHEELFGNIAVAEGGDLSHAVLVVPGADFLISWSSALKWLDGRLGNDERWIYEHPTDSATVIVERRGEKVRLFLNYKPDEVLEGDVGTFRQSLDAELNRFATRLAPLIAECPAEDTEEVLAEMEEAFAD